MLQDLQKTHPQHPQPARWLESILSFQLAATFHSVRLISNTKACPSCEIQFVSTSLLAGALPTAICLHAVGQTATSHLVQVFFKCVNAT